MEISFILYSDLDSGSGGVETWLRLFLDEINRDFSNYPVTKIHLYYYTSFTKKGDLPGKDYSFVKFHPLRVSTKRRFLLLNFITLIKFHAKAIRNIMKDSDPYHHIVSIGSYPSGIFNWYILKLFYFKKSFKHTIWLRTTLSKYIKTLTSKIFSGLILKLEKAALKKADLVISNGWDTRDNYLALGIDSLVIANAINYEIYKQCKDIKEIYGVKRIAFIGRFFDNKGIFNFVEAIKIFNNRFNEIRGEVEFVFVGWGETSIEKFATETDNCIYCGKVGNEQMPALLDKIHCGVALTKSNDFDAGGSGVSNGLLELMASGKLIIAFDNSIYRQFLNQTFLIYSPENDDDALADNFAHVARSNHLWYNTGKQAKFFAQSFSINEHVASFIKALDGISK